MNSTPRRAAIYARISLDKTDDELGVTRQAKEAQALCDARGYQVVATFTDNSISALSGKFREHYTAMMAAVGRGEVDVIVCYHLSRLWRNRRERAEGIEILKAHGVSLLTVKGTEFDLTSAYGRAMAGLVGEFDTMESEVKAERQRSQMRQAAEAGKFPHGGNRPYGFNREHATVPGKDGKPTTRVVESVNEQEADIIRECTRRLLAGETLISLARDLNARGVPTVTGKRWTTPALRGVMSSARVSGRREHTPTESWKGKTRRPLLGEIVAVGCGPEIISPADSDRVRSLLSNPARRTSPRVARRTMLTGILTCAGCGRGMVSRPRAGRTSLRVHRRPGPGIVRAHGRQR